MKRQSIRSIFLLLSLAMIPAAFAQSLPASMAYSSSALVRNGSGETGQELLIADNGLTQDHHPAFDLSEIPAAPGSVVRNPKIASISKADGTAATTPASTENASKLERFFALLGVLALAYLATRKRADERIDADIRAARNFPKKRLAQREAHA